MGDPKGQMKAMRKEVMAAGSPTKEVKGKKPGAPTAGPKRPLAIVRMAGTDLDGNKPTAIALMRIKGVGYNLARAVLRVADVPFTITLKDLTEEQTTKIEEVIEKPSAFGIPIWMLNRRKDLATGENIHISGSDLPMTWRQDIESEKRVRSWKGIRHEVGLPVRGQHTRTSGRKGTRVGVVRKKIMPGAAASEKKEEKKK